MNEKLQQFTVASDDCILLALKKIDANKQGFLIVLEESGKACGVLTDGDIRRSFIQGCTTRDSISGVYTRNARFVKKTDSFDTVSELFKNESIKFLPILDDDRHLVNIITKSQMHALLLLDVHADLNYDFSSIDTRVIDHEIYQRPWGFYKTTILNDYYQSKVISVRPGEKLSLQSHNHREEHWIIVHGTGIVQLEQSHIAVCCGMSVFIPKGVRHRLINTDDKESLIINEVQIGDYLGEDDIVRYEDEYGRT